MENQRRNAHGASPVHSREYKKTGSGNRHQNDRENRQELLVVSYGEEDSIACQKALCCIEGALETAFPEWSIRRAFTGVGMIESTEDRDGLRVDSVSQAMERAAKRGVRVLTIQPTHVAFGKEYHDLVHELVEHYGNYDEISLAQPLLSSGEDFRNVAEILVRSLREYNRRDTAVCFVGRGAGTAHENTYLRMSDALTDVSAPNFFAAPVGQPREFLAQLRKTRCRSVVLIPFTLAVDTDIVFEMDGSHSGAWRTILEAAGYSVTCLLRGLGELKPIRDIYVRHTRDAIRVLEEAAAYAQ